MSLVYLYCLLPGDAQVEVDGIPAMEPEQPLRLVRAGSLAAAVSDVGAQFEEANLNARIRDLDWLSARAVRHHEVVDQLYGRCKPVLPLTFGVIFTSSESLAERLLSRETELLASLDQLRDREEWNLKLTRDQATFANELRRHSDEVREIELELATKTPGMRFLLEKKLQNVQAREAKRISAGIRAEVHETLGTQSVQAHRDDLATPPESQALRLELRSAYLVEQAHADGLKNAVLALSRKYASLGYQFELTGPWPAFSFAGGLREALS